METGVGDFKNVRAFFMHEFLLRSSKPVQKKGRILLYPLCNSITRLSPFFKGNSVQITLKKYFYVFDKTLKIYST